MATLTGQKIKDTYDGLLKIDDSSVGLPASGKIVITDGLGSKSALNLGKINNGAEITGTLKIKELTDSTTNAATVSEIITEAKTIAANDNDTSIPTSAAVKDYVDAVPVPASESLAQTLAVGNTTSGKDIEISFGDKIKFGEFVLSKTGTFAGGNLNGEIDLLNGNSSSLLRIKNNNGIVQLYSRFAKIDANETQINGGQVGINTVGINPEDQLHVNGTIRASLKQNDGSSNKTDWAFIGLNDEAKAASGLFYYNNSAELILKNSSDVQVVKITSGLNKSYINTTGYFGIGTTTPQKKFEVQGGAVRFTTLDIFSSAGSMFLSSGSGTTIYFGEPIGSNVQNISASGTIKSTSSIQSGNNTAAASAQLAGSQRYYVSGNNSYVDVCMQTGATTYEWVNIKTNTW